VTEGEIRSVRAFYDDLAPTYESIYADWETSVQRQGDALHRLLSGRLAQQQALRILDCACGIGTQALGLLRHGHAVVGSDLSPRAVGRATQFTADTARGGRFVVADMRRLPFRAAAFDAVVSADNALPHLLTDAALRSALQEMARVTTPNGALLISLRDYADALDSHPAARPPSVSGGPGQRTITFQLWRWHEDGVHYDVEMFQLREAGDDWQVSSWTMPSWALSRAVVEEAAQGAGWTDLHWIEPADSGFFQPVLLATRQFVP
jgi:glycine/sarcosine N-methyltransferase